MALGLGDAGVDRAGDVFEVERAVIVDVGTEEDVGGVGGQALLVEIPGLHPEGTPHRGGDVGVLCSPLPLVAKMPLGN